ncbi:MAG: NADH-quinone oxidoreductase subunit M [Deltaproteobacteria bacterium]|nr:NADH-quinone oxidoreductase subunit M [Deltaproteobacteria bacterium]
MILVWLIILPFAGGILAWALSHRGSGWPRWISLAAMSADMVLALLLWAQYYPRLGFTTTGQWLIDFERPWIHAFGVSFHLAIDSLSLLLILLTAFLGVLSVACSWTEIQSRVGFFHFNLLWVLAGLIGVFLALDLFLFYFFWEMMLVPMYFLIAVWGHERRIYASVKFFIFTQLSGLLMLLAILALYFIHGNTTGTYTFNYLQLLGTAMPPSTAMWLMLGFLIAFAVKLPVVPVHTWLPDAHTEAPTAGSVILAGLLLKTGAYGLLRFVLPLFPQAATEFAPVAMVLAVVGILYGAWVAFGQTDLKRLVAYTSVSHMGFVLLGVFAWNELALQGAVVEIICHGISTGALFILVGALQERVHTREMERMGGLWATVPRMGGVGMVFALASLGLPGLGNFVGEFLVLLGVYQISAPLAAWAALGLVSAAVYSLWIVQKAFHGAVQKERRIRDLSPREMAVFTSLMAVIVWIGLYPQPLLNTAKPALEALQRPPVFTSSPLLQSSAPSPVGERIAIIEGALKVKSESEPLIHVSRFTFHGVH